MNKKKLILIIIFFIAALGASYYFLFSKTDKAGNTVADNTFGWQFPVADFPLVGLDDNQLAYSRIRDPGGIPEGLPVRLKVPAIGVDSAVEDALITPDGRMDVPAGTINVAWFALGPNPGEVGSAVIGGHYGIYENNRGPTVFYYLDQMKVGDKVYIENDKGDTLTFQVRKIELFDRNADATTVFTSNDGLAHLNLITCEGIWNRVAGTYPLRRVVFTDFMPGETAPAKVTEKSLEKSIFYRTLKRGTRGADVVALQNELKQKGFFGTQTRASDGIFGRLTHAAVAKYQASVGLKPDGIFGSLSRAKLVSGQAKTAIDSKLPPTGIIVPLSALSFHQIFIQSAKNLFATPLDALITLILFISIFFVSFKIIRRT